MNRRIVTTRVVTMRCEFAIALPADPDDDSTVGAVQDALEAGTSWSCCRVAAIRQPDPGEGWHLDVWTVPLSGSIEDLARACESVYEVVTSVVPGAGLLACRCDERASAGSDAGRANRRPDRGPG
jgi:hypothetical protein